MTELLTSTHFWLAVAFMGVVLVSVRPVGRLIKKAGAQRAAQIRQEQEEAISHKKEAMKRLEQIKALTTNKENIRKSILKRALVDVEAMTQDFKERLKVQLRKREEETVQLMANYKDRSISVLRSKIYQAFAQKLMEQTLTMTDAEMDAFFENMDVHALILKEAYHDNPIEEKNQEISVQQAIVQGAYATLKKEEEGVDDRVLEKILSALDTIPQEG